MSAGIRRVSEPHGRAAAQETSQTTPALTGRYNTGVKATTRSQMHKGYVETRGGGWMENGRRRGREEGRGGVLGQPFLLRVVSLFVLLKLWSNEMAFIMSF